MSAPGAEVEQHTPLRDVLTGMLFAGVAACLYLQTADFPVSARTYPRIVLGAIVVLSLVQAVRGTLAYVALRRTRRPVGDGRLLPRVGPGAPFALAAVAYVFAITTVGYLVSTVVFLVATVGVRAGWRLRVIGPTAAVGVTLYLVLEHLLNISVPQGWLL